MIDQPLTFDEARMALSFVSASCDRDTWFKVGAALKDEFGDAGFDLFDEWSQSGEGYNKTDCRDTFRSASAGHITVATLIKMAVDGGWQRDVKELTAEQKAKFAAERAQRATERKARVEADAVHLLAMQKAVSAASRALIERFCEPVTKKVKHVYMRSKPAAKAGVFPVEQPAPRYPHAYLEKKQVNGHGVYLVKEDCHFISDEQTQQTAVNAGAYGFFSQATPDHIHPFNFKKGDLIIPLRDELGAVWSVQRIDAAGVKMFAKFSRKKGCFVLIGDPAANKPLAFAEGYATGATVHELTGWPVVVCIDAGNMATVAGVVDYPNNKKIWLADRDKPDEKTGKRKGQVVTAACQKKYGGAIALPVFNKNTG